MAQRINEDIRFYLPADPYYYQVDNLPLEDLLANDVRLQNQIDSIQSSDGGNTVGRAGFTELQPFIDTGLPGSVSVRPGNFVGRVQSSAGAGLAGGAAGVHAGFNGLWEVNDPPTTFGTGDNPTGTYSVDNPPNVWTNPGDWVGRTALFNFMGGNISIDAFDFNSDFAFPTEYPHDGTYNTTVPQGRIDLIGITTMNGAMDDVWLPGNAIAPGVEVGDGTPRLAVVKGAGIVPDLARRQVVIGEKFLTVGLPQEELNDYGRNFEGDVVPNPEFGTVPGPDDVVNANFARDIMENGEIAQTLQDWADSNKNASFFLPLAYVYVPQSHVEGAPIPEQYLRDIRPFFRTAELAQTERQAIAASLAPSVNNPFVTEEHAKTITGPAISDLTNIVNDFAVRITILEELVGKPQILTIQRSINDRYTTQGIFLDPGQYLAQCTIVHGVAGAIVRTFRWGVNVGGSFNAVTQTTPNVTFRDNVVNDDDDTIATQQLYFTVPVRGLYQLVCPQPNTSVYDGASFKLQTLPDGTDLNIVGQFIKVRNLQG